MSLKQIEKYQKYTPLIPYAVGGVAIGALALGGFYVYTRIRGLVPTMPDINVDLPSWLQTPVDITTDPVGHIQEGKEVKAVLQEAYDKAILEYDRRFWDTAVTNIPSETYIVHPFLLIWVQTKTLELETELEKRLHVEIRPRDPIIVTLEHEIELLEQDRQNNAELLILEKQKAAKELELEKQRLQHEAERARILEQFQAATSPEAILKLLKGYIQVEPQPTTLSPVSGISMVDYYKSLGFEIREVQLSDLGVTWNEIEDKYGGDRVNEYTWGLGASKEERAPSWIRVRTYYDLSGASPPSNMSLINQKWMWVIPITTTPTPSPYEGPPEA
jgi:hypothetical protein